MPVRPIIQSLLLADHIYVDAASGKKIIAGTFNRLVCDEFPTTTVVSKFALLAMTDVHGSADVTIRFVDLSGGDTLLELQGLSVSAEDPLETVELVVELPPLPLPHAGAFAFEVHWDGETLGQMRLFLDSMTSEAPSDEDL